MPTVNLALHKDLILKTPKCANRITALYEAGLRIVAVSRVCRSYSTCVTGNRVNEDCSYSYDFEMVTGIYEEKK